MMVMANPQPQVPQVMFVRPPPPQPGVPMVAALAFAPNDRLGGQWLTCVPAEYAVCPGISKETGKPLPPVMGRPLFVCDPDTLRLPMPPPPAPLAAALAALPPPPPLVMPVPHASAMSRVLPDDQLHAPAAATVPASAAASSTSPSAATSTSSSPTSVAPASAAPASAAPASAAPASAAPASAAPASAAPASATLAALTSSTLALAPAAPASAALTAAPTAISASAALASASLAALTSSASASAPAAPATSAALASASLAALASSASLAASLAASAAASAASTAARADKPSSPGTKRQLKRKFTMEDLTMLEPADADTVLAAFCSMVQSELAAIADADLSDREQIARQSALWTRILDNKLDEFMRHISIDVLRKLTAYRRYHRAFFPTIAPAPTGVLDGHGYLDIEILRQRVCARTGKGSQRARHKLCDDALFLPPC